MITSIIRNRLFFLVSRNPRLFFIVLVCIFSSTSITSFAQENSASTTVKQTPVGTSKIWGQIDGISIEGMVQGPATEVAPLQVACIFEYTEGDIYNSPPALPAALNGMVHLDQALKGLITEIRRSGKFSGHALETILIIPPKGTIAASKLLLIGLGDRNSFNPDFMKKVGVVSMREALRLGVSHYAVAADIKDAGIASPTAAVAGNIVRGAISAYQTQSYLKAKEMGNFAPLTKLTLLSGMNFFEDAGEGIKAAISEFQVASDSSSVVK